ncbi:hypothetical protein ACFLVH_03330 [Chloroflexota bacterium]
MKKYQGGEAIAAGVYLNLATWELVQLYDEKPVLPGKSGVKYVKVPAPFAVLAGPFAGLAFIIFLPFIGIVGIISFLAYKIGQGALVLGRKTLQPVMIGWKPGRAYLTRKGGAPRAEKLTEEPEPGLPDMSITDIAEEISKRRQRGEK